MKANHLIITCTAVAMAAYEHAMRVQAEKKQEACLRATYEIAEKFQSILNINTAQIQWLLHVLDENDVEVTEFDLLVLNFNQS